MLRKRRDSEHPTVPSRSNVPKGDPINVNKFKYTFWISSLILVVGLASWVYFLNKDLPSLTQLEKYEPELVTQIFSADGKVIQELFTHKRVLVPLEKIPPELIHAAIATEDNYFYDHWGVNLRNVFTSVAIDLVTLSKKRGFSTITMQLARNLYPRLLTSEKKITRKIKEILTTLELEKTYSKKEILEMYFNTAYFGHGAYGVQSAAKKFFAKDVTELTLTECALLVGQLKATGAYSPLQNPLRAIQRRNVVLHNMMKNGFITEEKYRQSAILPLGVVNTADEEGIGPYFAEYVRQKLNEKQNIYGFNVYQDGLKIYTTLDSRVQICADEAAKNFLPIMQRLVYRRLVNSDYARGMIDPENQLNDAAWEKLKTDTLATDTLLFKKYPLQMSLVAIDPANGHVLAMIGGRDFTEYKFNRAVQALRQPGSAFKPFIYTAAIDNGYPVTYQLLNQPVVLVMDDGKRWSPENYERTVGGLTTLREGLRRSINLVAIRLLQEVVEPRVVVDYAKAMGITTRIRPVDAMALGVSEVYLLDMVSAYGVFPNKGIRVEPISILRIEDRNGSTVEENQPIRREALSEETAYIMTDLLRTAATTGTGVGRFLYGFNRIAAGKTGTTNEFTDAWYVGFTPQIVAGVWVGFDDPKMTLGPGSAGASIALPIWATFMKAVHDSLRLPEKDFEMPPGVIRLKICDESKKLATDFCPTVIEEIFNQKYQPTERCDIHKKPEKNLNKRKNF